MKKTHENHDRNYHNFVIQRPAAGEKSQVIQPQACHLSLDEVSLPSAVIHASALNNNLKWMQQFANHHQVKLAPHGKTSMTPDFSSMCVASSSMTKVNQPQWSCTLPARLVGK